MENYCNIQISMVRVQKELSEDNVDCWRNHQYFLLLLYKSYRTLRTLFGGKYEIVQISRDYRDNFEVCK